MKLTLTAPLISCLLFGQLVAGAGESFDSAQAAIEKEIRILEAREVQAVLDHDVATLELLWDGGFVVNNPEGRVVMSDSNVMNRPVMQTRRSTFTREIESIAIRGDVAISMGSETVVPYIDQVTAGDEIRRRYTNVWMLRDGSWKLIARHANRICSED